jgi:hypothetical protein
MTVRHLIGGSGLIERVSVIRSFGGFEHQHSESSERFRKFYCPAVRSLCSNGPMPARTIFS